MTNQLIAKIETSVFKYSNNETKTTSTPKIPLIVALILLKLLNQQNFKGRRYAFYTE